jgi:hypothetical protein
MGQITFEVHEMGHWEISYLQSPPEYLAPVITAKGRSKHG